jgi:hypothetical protein
MNRGCCCLLCAAFRPRLGRPAYLIPSVVEERPHDIAFGECCTPRAFALVWARLSLFLDYARNDSRTKERGSVLSFFSRG